jgi:uncharacterized protein (DUF1810 family)
MADADLERFHDGYRHHFDDARRDQRRPQNVALDVVHLPPGRRTRHQPNRRPLRHPRPREADAVVQDPILGPGYRTLVDAVWRQVIGSGVSLRTLFGRPDDRKLVSSLTLFAGVASQLGEWATTVAQATEILDHADTQGLARCATTERFLVGGDARS